MRNFPSATRTKYLSDTLTPLAKITLRRLRLDFGSALYVENDGAVIDGANKQGDDHNDPVGYRVLWGDSCVQAVSPYNKFRLLAKAAWSSASNNMWRSHTTGSDWSLTAMTAPESILAGCRIGVYPKSDGKYRVWFLNSGSDVKVYDLDPSTWGWTSVGVTQLDVTVSGAAFHPVSESEAILVYYEDPTLYAKYLKWNGSSWTTNTHVVIMSDELVWSDAHWSDAVVNPDDGGEIVVALNLNRWGSAHALIYNKASGIWSHPREIMPSAEQWGNLKVWLSGLTVINNRIWGVTVREPVGSRDVRMAHHVALVSSPDGRHWRDDGFVTTSTLRGKLLYRANEGYCYVAGNASVARAQASIRLGYDNSALKHEAVEVFDLTVNYSGPSSAPAVTVTALNDGDSLPDSGLLEAGNELAVEMGASGQSYGDYCKATLASASRGRAHGEDVIQLHGIGYMGRILGSLSYRPPAARVYDGPYVLYSKFEFDNKEPRLTVSQHSGLWVVEKLPPANQHVLYCKKAGISLVPHSLGQQRLVARTKFQAKVSLEGVYFVFWWEDESNYWQAGIYAEPDVGHRLVITRFVNGVRSIKKNVSAGTVSVGTWYTLYLETKPGQIRIYFGDDYDFSSPLASTSYDVTQETSGAPSKHHVGLKVSAFSGWEGADITGTVTDSDNDRLADDTKTFTSGVVGKWVRCNEQDREIVDYDPTVVYIEPYWADVPGVGAEYGIYTESAKDGPQAYFRDLLICEGILPWSVDGIADDILELAGVSRDTSVYTDTAVPDISGNPPTMRDVDVVLESSANPAQLALWASTTGSGTWHGLKVSVGTSSTSLIMVEGASSSTVAVHPNMITLPSGTKRIRVQATKDIIIISCDGHFVTAFDLNGLQPGGYVFRVSSGTATKREFVDVLDSFIWDTNQPAAAALARLLKGRRAKLVERSDGDVAISRFDSPLGDAGTYQTTLTSLQTSDDGASLVSLVEMVGAEERAFYVDEEAARKALRYVRADNPTLETQAAAQVEAYRTAILSRQLADQGEVELHVPDPALEVEDKFTVDGRGYIAQGIMWSWEMTDEGPSIMAQIAAKKALPAVVEGTWGDGTTRPGDCDYDDGTQYGG